MSHPVIAAAVAAELPRVLAARGFWSRVWRVAAAAWRCTRVAARTPRTDASRIDERPRRKR